MAAHGLAIRAGRREHAENAAAAAQADWGIRVSGWLGGHGPGLGPPGGLVTADAGLGLHSAGCYQREMLPPETTLTAGDVAVGPQTHLH
jgi:hypothetical protein